MRAAVLIAAMLLTFVAVPGAILAFHDPPPSSPRTTQPTVVEQATDELSGKGYTGIQCQDEGAGQALCTANPSNDESTLSVLLLDFAE
jgi:hypothetical protein